MLRAAVVVKAWSSTLAPGSEQGMVSDELSAIPGDMDLEESWRCATSVVMWNRSLVLRVPQHLFCKPPRRRTACCSAAPEQC
jgi:hypothetical protein